MPRNIAKSLSPAEHAIQSVRHIDLLDRMYKAKIVTVSYKKRDETVSSSTGTVGFFSGVPGMDTGSVTIETTDKGPRTINLHRIISID